MMTGHVNTPVHASLRNLAVLLGFLSLILSSACEEEAISGRHEAGVIDVIDYGFEDAGIADRPMAADACVVDGSCE